MSNPAWLEVMPAIPLARGVPVRCTRISDSAVVVAAGPEGVVLADRHAVDQYEGTGHWWRVDIDDPQGFGYALRHALDKDGDTTRRMGFFLVSLGAPGVGEQDAFDVAFWAFMTGQKPSAAFKIAVAKACAEVLP